MSPDQIRTFLAVSRHLNHTRAAAELNLSQSAVWRQVRHLEQDLGVRLVEQLGKALHLTDAGRTLAREGEQLLGPPRADQGVRADARQGAARAVRIGASTTPGYYLLPRVLGRLHRDHPEIELRYEIENSSRIEQQLLRNELDLGFVGGPVQCPELDTEELANDHVVCFAATSHPLARAARIRPDKLVQETCVMREQGSATRQLFESWLLGAGCRLERSLIVASPQAAMSLVAAGMGFSFISSLALRERARASGVVELNVARLDIRRPITVAWHHGKHLSAAMTHLLHLARTEMRAGD